MLIQACQYFNKLDCSRILITGASGWLGHELLCALHSVYPDFRSLNLTLAGNSHKTIDIHGQQLFVAPLREIKTQNNFDLIIHLAFVTQDKMSHYGENVFISMNSELNCKIQEISDNNPQAKKLILSSGAVSQYLAQDNENLPMKTYARLKQELEAKFLNEDSLVLRLWNTTGHHLNLELNSKYAISEFISCAKENSPIMVGKNLRRTYVDAGSVLKASISYLISGGNGIVNSGGDSISLKDLAELVTEVLESTSRVSLNQDGSFPSLDYVSPISEIPLGFWPDRVDLRNQIRNTANIKI